MIFREILYNCRLIDSCFLKNAAFKTLMLKYETKSKLKFFVLTFWIPYKFLIFLSSQQHVCDLECLIVLYYYEQRQNLNLNVCKEKSTYSESHIYE